MPEGDTIHAVARVMAPDLVGQALTHVALDKLAQSWAPGAVVTGCEAVGKHLLIRVLPGPSELGVAGRPLVLRVHLGMKGSWHRYRPGEAWQRSPSQARVELGTARWVFVCFGPKEVQLVGRHAPRPDMVAHLGPDLLAPSFDAAVLDQIVHNCRHPARAAMALGDVLLTQTVAAGIGNVYKSEVLFLEALNPWTPLASLGDDDLRRVYRRAQALMQQNLDDGGWRITTLRPPPGARVSRGERYWVYRRAGEPCRRCATLVRSRLQGLMARRAYWCPSCQPRVPGGPADGKGA